MSLEVTPMDDPKLDESESRVASIGGGPGDIAARLTNDEADTVLLIYRMRGGKWVWGRQQVEGRNATLEEIGAVHRLASWLEEMMRDDDGEEDTDGER